MGFQTSLILQRAWMKLRFDFCEWKIGRKRCTTWTLFVCKFTVCLNLRGCTSAGENLENPLRLSGCLPAGDRLPSATAFCFLRTYSLISREHATRAQSMAKNQTELYQALNYSKRMNIRVWTYWWMKQLDTFTRRGLRKFFQFLNNFLCWQPLK